MRILYNQAKHHQPVTRDVVLDEIEKAKELDVGYPQTLRQGGNAQCTSECTMQEILECQAFVVRQDVMDDFRQSPFFTLQADEGTYPFLRSSSCMVGT